MAFSRQQLWYVAQVLLCIFLVSAAITMLAKNADAGGCQNCVRAQAVIAAPVYAQPLAVQQFVQPVYAAPVVQRQVVRQAVVAPVYSQAVIAQPYYSQAVVQRQVVVDQPVVTKSVVRQRVRQPVFRSRSVQRVRSH